MAGANKAVRVVGGIGKQKNEKCVNDSRDSITVYWSFTAAGNDGPSAFLTKGQRRKKGFMDGFLQRYGAAEGSTIIPTKSAFMDTVTWESLTPYLINGYRSTSKHAKASPHW